MPSGFAVVLLLALTCALSGPLPAQSQPARVALILDRESSRFQPLLDATAREIREFFRPGEIELLPPLVGDGTGPGITALLNRTFWDPSISVVVTLGSISSHLLARSGSPSKPAIAATVIDASWQGILGAAAMTLYLSEYLGFRTSVTPTPERFAESR